MPNYRDWVSGGGWSEECPSGISKSIWESCGRQKYRIECQYKNRGRNWAPFIRELEDDLVERLRNDVAQWTTDYSDHMGSTDDVQNLVALHYSLYIPLYTLKREKSMICQPQKMCYIHSYLITSVFLSLKGI